MSSRPLVAVVGAGPAGIAAAVELRHVGIDAVVLEQAEHVAHTWRNAYDRLRLNTSRLTSRLVGMRYAAGSPLFPSRDEFVSYLERIVAAHRLDVRGGRRVERIDRDRGAWTLRTSTGDVRAPHVIVATGYARQPYVPSWPGRGRFRRGLVHSAHYRNADPYRASDVLVVGAGSSGMEIAYDLSEGGAARVRVAVRTPPNIVLRFVGGLPGDLIGVAMLRLPARVADAIDRRVRPHVLGDLAAYGLPQPQEGPFARLRRAGVGATVVDRDVLEALKDRRIEVVAGVESLEPTAVRLADGTLIEPDAVIAATGYRCGLEDLVGHLGVLDERGVPTVVGGREAATGLRFVGFVPVPGQMRRISAEARRAAKGIACAMRPPHAEGASGRSA